MSLGDRLRERRLLKTVEEGRRKGYPVDEMAKAIPEIGQAIEKAERNAADRAARKSGR